MPAITIKCHNIFFWLNSIESFVENFGKLIVHVYSLYRSSRPEVFCKEGVLWNFAKFTGKHLCQSLFFKKFAGLRPLLKKRLWYRYFLVNFVKFFRTSFLQNTSWRLLLALLIRHWNQLKFYGNLNRKSKSKKV